MVQREPPVATYMYARPVIPGWPFPRPRPAIDIMLDGPDLSRGIPILSCNRYHYVRVTKILEYIKLGNFFERGLQMWWR